jgi:hypothetical protein
MRVDRCVPVRVVGRRRSSHGVDFRWLDGVDDDLVERLPVAR